MLTFVYQRPQDLMLSVSTGEIRSPLKVLKQQAVLLEGWRFVFTIIGESHWVRIERRPQWVLHEVLACVPVQAEPYLFQYNGGGYPAEFGWERYRVALRFESDGDPEPAPPDPDGVLALEFPQIHGVIPTTQIRWKKQGGTLAWWTTHTYPGPTQTTLVRTLSTFHLSEEASP